MKQTTIAIIGAGSVGSTTAYSLMLNNVTSKIIMVDNNEKRSEAETEDLSDALPFNRTKTIQTGTYKQAGQADIAIICAGAAQQPGQTRMDLLTANVDIISSILDKMAPISKDLILIMVSNPVDILTQLAQNLTGLPKNQVIGSGTLLDTDRWRGYIRSEIGIAEQSIHAYIIDNHGKDQVPVISSASIAGTPLTNYLSTEKLQELADKAKNKAAHLIDNKQCTQFGIASCVTALCASIVFNQKLVLPVVSFSEEYQVYMSLPITLGAQGVGQNITIALSEDEKKALNTSAKNLQDAFKTIK
ncbi:L-lactate dehydrogenase [bacterium]|jgi:L-lactate dehydrogenase|nr:L-lactate dehydrogenase [bacterium]MBT5015219.1 L-lactate dehydrogenase [bacterium]